MLNVTCPKCGHEMKFKDVAAGRVVKCSQCGGKVRAPSADYDDSDTSPVEPRRRGSAKEPDQRLDKRLRLEDSGRSKERQSPHTPEWVLPTVLIGAGLVLTVVAVLIKEGAGEAAATLLSVIVQVFITVPLDIAGLFLVASLLGVSFGTMGLAALRLAAISVLTLGILLTCTFAGWFLMGLLLAIPIGWFLFSYFFDLNLFETLVSLFVLGLIERLVGKLVEVMFASRAGM